MARWLCRYRTLLHHSSYHLNIVMTLLNRRHLSIALSHHRVIVFALSRDRVIALSRPRPRPRWCKGVIVNYMILYGLHRDSVTHVCENFLFKHQMNRQTLFKKNPIHVHVHVFETLPKI